MNLLKTIIERLNQRVEVANIFDKQFGLCELNANGNEKAWVHYIGNGQAEVVTNFDAKQGTLFWAKRGKVTVVKTDAYKMSGCKQLYVTSFPLTAYAVVRKSHLPCDGDDAQDWLASRIYKLTSGTDPQFKQNLGVINYEVIPSGYINEIKTLTANYEWACVTVDFDIQVITTTEDGCYDICSTGDIPLPDFQPCTPCLTEVAVDGVTIIGNGTEADPLIAVGGGGGTPLITKNEGTNVSTNTTTLNFTGAGVTASLTSPGVVEVNVPGGGGGGVTSVSGTAPIASSGGATPAISISQASTSTDGYLSQADWDTFNGKFNVPTGTSADYLDGTGAPTAFPTIPSTPSLEDVVNVGNSSTLDIDFGVGAGLEFANTARVREGTTDAGLGGAKGVALICSNAYELKWEAGRLYYMQQDGFTIRDVTHNFTLVPQVTDDSSKGFVVGSRWSLDDGTVYLCSDDTIGAAVWAVVAVGGVTSVTGTAPIASSGGATPDITITQADGSTDGYLTSTDWNTFNGKGTVSSVDLTMPAAFSVTGNPVTSSGTLAVAAAGLSSQYIRGDGQLANFPTSTGGGSSVSYYLNGSVNQGTIGGSTYYEMSRTPILGAGTDFTRTNAQGNGLIAQFITDAGDPNLLAIPAGNWNLELFFSSSASGGSPSFYVELYKYDGATFTLIATDSAAPEGITNGTSIDAYFTALAVPATTLAVTDRLALRVFVTTSGRTITLHTEDNHLCQVITTFSTGLNSLNGLTAQVQNFAVGTSGTDFAISSATDTHTFNLPTASASNRGALSTADWSTFNGKQDALVSGTNIKTINSTSLLGSGNITIASLGVYKNTIDGAASSGTANTFSSSVLVPANSVSLGSVLEFKLRGRKTGAANTYTIRIYANSANNLTGAVLLGVYTGGQTGAFGQQMVRTGVVKNPQTNTEMMSTAVTNVATDYQNTTFSSISVDWTSDKYIIGAVQNTNGADSSLISLISMTII
jgi:hypothetical protein